MNFDRNKLKRDVHLGLKMEEIVKPVLENKFGELENTKKYATFDFINDKYVLELKSRNVPFGKYPSLMFGKNKLDEAKEIVKEGIKDVYFIFKLTDGIYYWQYKEGEYKIAQGGRRDRGKDEIKPCAFINNEYIKNINDLPNLN